MNLAHEFAAAQTGGGTSLLTPEELHELTIYAQGHGAIVCPVETYELRGGFEIATPHLGIWYEDDGFSLESGPERLRQAGIVIEETLALCAKEAVKFGFKAWVELV